MSFTQEETRRTKLILELEYKIGKIYRRSEALAIPVTKLTKQEFNTIMRILGKGHKTVHTPVKAAKPNVPAKVKRSTKK